jgi:hypothetical protein
LQEATLRKSRILAAALAALSMAACARATGGPAGPGPSDVPAYGDGDLVLRMEVGGGFVAPEYSITQLPAFSLYGDGRVIQPGAQIEIYPQPALPAVDLSLVDERGMHSILQAAREAGLYGPNRHYDACCIADAPTTTFTLTERDGTRHVVSAYALSESSDNDPAMSDEDREARRKLAELGMKLTSLSGWLPDGSIEDSGQFRPERMRVYVRAGAPSDDQGLDEPSERWTIEPALAQFGQPVDLPSGYRCGAIGGGDLDAMLPAFRDANQLTPWVSSGAGFQLILRPLLPDEPGCP